MLVGFTSSVSETPIHLVAQAHIWKHPWLLSLSLSIITKSWWFYFQNAQWTDIAPPLLQLHLVQTIVSYRPLQRLPMYLPLCILSFFSIQWPQWSFKNQLGLKTLQRFPKDKISDLYCGLQGPTRPDSCLHIATLLSPPPLTFPLVCTGCLPAFAGTHQMYPHLMVFALISPA